MSRLWRTALCLFVFASLLTAVPASGQGNAPGQDTDCIIRDDVDLHAASKPTAEGHFPHEDWAVHPSSQGVFRGVEMELARRFGVDTEAAPSTTVGRGLIGAVADHHARQFVVVVDPDLSGDSSLRDALERIAQRGGKGRAFVRLLAGCNSAADLVAAGDRIAQRSWHPRAAGITFGYGLDAHTSTYVATFAAEDADVAEALKAELGDLVTIEYGDPEPRGRLDDGEPHYGGAGIRAANQSTNHCTSGFTVRLPNGSRGSVTAAHCFRYTGTTNGRNVYSGPQYYGQTDGASGFPTYDMVRIHPFGETFANIIHVDPCCPSLRTVTGRGNPGLHEFICVSGMVTRAVCGIEVTNTNYNYCAPDGCTPNTFLARKPGTVVGRGGDSGAPAYVRPTTSTAHIRGMEIGGTASDNFVGHKISTIESHLSVTVATN